MPRTASAKRTLSLWARRKPSKSPYPPPHLRLILLFQHSLQNDRYRVHSLLLLLPAWRLWDDVVASCLRTSAAAPHSC